MEPSKMKVEVCGDIMHEGFVQVFRNHNDKNRDNFEEYNFICPDGKLLCKQWWDSCERFNEGFARVRLNGKYNFINHKGEILSPNLWFDGAFSFTNGFSVIFLKEKDYNFIDKKGKILSPNRWFKSAWSFNETGHASVWFGNETGIIDTTGKIIISTNFDHVETFVNGFARVCKRDEKDYYVWNLINTKGELVSEDWYEHVGFFKNGFCHVINRGKYNFIDTQGKILSPNIWFDSVHDFDDSGFALVYQYNLGYNCLNSQGQISWPKWIDSK